MNAAREIGIAARDQHEVASKGAVRRHVPGFVRARAKPMVGPEQLQRASHGDQLGRRAGYEEPIAVVLVDNGIRVEVVELDPEYRMPELGPRHDGVDAFGESVTRLRTERGRQQRCDEDDDRLMDAHRSP